MGTAVHDSGPKPPPSATSTTEAALARSPKGANGSWSWSSVCHFSSAGDPSPGTWRICTISRFANEAKRADRLWCHWTTDGSSIKHDRHGKSTSTPRTRTAARDATLSRSSRAFAHAVAVISARYEPINLLSPLAAAGNAEREQLEPAGITLWFVKIQEKTRLSLKANLDMCRCQ